MAFRYPFYGFNNGIKLLNDYDAWEWGFVTKNSFRAGLKPGATTWAEPMALCGGGDVPCLHLNFLPQACDLRWRMPPRWGYEKRKYDVLFYQK
ncbi:hypothetical protein [Mucilaginibacter flavidus]|uniref:hypothetical protein n=1 Tax=Mucilaginibacter flavidus TaxID=2949309 RepID=UPI00209349CD|nr:hypothetical protein [Mucilaginibacter flavidus]MCO5950616.1 hypothetical protein [Mucilaginibacter flavidus]